MRRLTVQQRQAIQKTACLVLSVAMLAGALMAVPYLVGAIPKMTGAAAQKLTGDTEALAQAVPVFALGSGNNTDESETSSEVSAESVPEPEISVPTLVPDEDDLFVTPSNLCWYEIGETPTLNLIDRTSYGVDLEDYITRDFPVSGTITDAPLVLIIHTHGSESYLPSGCDFYDPEEDYRSTDESETVVHIGELLSDKLNSLGIPAIHDKTMHDVPDYSDSYNNSLAAMKEYLAQYPSIKFVIDVHRDSVFDSAGNNIKPYTEIEGNGCAQLMLVMGTNEQGIPHPDWRDNLTFAAYLQQQVNTMYPTLMRPVNLRTAEFNQALTKGSVILEVGSCGNTVEEAENAISLFAEAYATLISEQLK